jgi:hypothetical protein
MKAISIYIRLEVGAARRLNEDEIIQSSLLMLNGFVHAAPAGGAHL